MNFQVSVILGCANSLTQSASLPSDEYDPLNWKSFIEVVSPNPIGQILQNFQKPSAVVLNGFPG